MNNLNIDLQQYNTPSGRFYETPEGILYPSVTTVLGSVENQGIQQWKEAVGEEEAQRVMKRAGRRGTRIHNYIETYLTTGQVKFNSYIDQDLLAKSLPFLDKFKDVMFLEKKLYSHVLRSAGTVDAVCRIAGRPIVADWKTSNQPKHHNDIHGYFMQASCYALMVKELLSIDIKSIVIVVFVEGDQPQFFIEKRDNWIDSYMDIRNQFTLNIENDKIAV